MNKTLLVIIDGLRSDALERAHVPTLDYLFAQGSSCLAVKTVNPSITLPCHFSIFTSLAPYSHGVLTNTALPDTSALGQSLLCHIKNAGGTVSSFYSWDHLRNLVLPGIMDYVFFQRLTCEKDLILLANAASACILTRKPDFCFIYFEWTDLVGHESGWMSDEYLKALEITDQALSKIVDTIHSIPEQQAYSLVIASDHGGKEKHHTADLPEITNVPFIAWGSNIRKGYRITIDMDLLDIAPTLAGILNIPPHFAWEGKEISQIMEKDSHWKPMTQVA